MRKKLITLLIVLGILAISSSLTYEQQTIIPILKNWLASKPFDQQLSWLKIPYYGTIISIESRGYFDFVEFLIRKATHFIGFGVIALVMYWILPSIWRWKGRIVITAISIIALADEIHQSFTPGRTMTFQDVFLDTAGAAVVVGIVTFSRKRSS